MKKLTRILCLTLALLCALPAWGLAESTDDDAVSQAYNDTTYTVIYYQYAYNPAGHVDLLRYGFDGVTGTLENGSKVAVTGMQEKGYTYIQYGSTYGWVKNSDLVSKLPEGTEEKDLKNVSYRYLVGDYMAPVYLYAKPGDAEDIGSLSAGAGILVAVHEWQGGWAYITFGGWKGWIKSSFLSVSSEEKGTARQTQTGGSASAKASGGGKSKVIPAQVLESGQPVSVVTLGTVDSEITVAGEKRQIPTAELTFGADAPRDQQTAVIYAPRTGRASLRRAASNTAAVLKTCKAGVIVAVLREGQEYTQVCCQGTVGYVKSSSLRFPAAAENPASALLTYKGRPGGATVNVRCAPDRESVAVAVWDAGTAVTVLSFADGWYEVEAKGIHGYVMEEFVTVGR